MKNPKANNKQCLNWENTLMKILECWYWQEGTWNSDHWHEYGLSDFDKKAIDKSFESFLKNKEKKKQEAKKPSNNYFKKQNKNDLVFDIQ
jgi:hypothetical protein